MGYDVDAFDFEGRSKSRDPELSAAFAAASVLVQSLGHGVDGFLSIGSLDCSASVSFLEEALGRKCGTGTGPILPDELKALSASARWPEPATVPEDRLWAYWSARKFLDVCVEQGLGIFSI